MGLAEAAEPRRLEHFGSHVALDRAEAEDARKHPLGSRKKTATIRVLDPADYRLPFKEMLEDMEFTVVHELIHLNFAPVVSEFQRSDANRREEEHAVNHMADALLKLDRNQ